MNINLNLTFIIASSLESVLEALMFQQPVYVVVLVAWLADDNVTRAHDKVELVVW